MILLMTSGENALHWSLSDFYDMDEIELLQWFNDFSGITSERADTARTAREKMRKNLKSKAR